MVTSGRVPGLVPNVIGGKDVPALDGGRFEKHDPARGTFLWEVARSTARDVDAAVAEALAAQDAWADLSITMRADILRRLALEMWARREDIADVAARETGKSRKDALGEIAAAYEMGMFMAGEGRRSYGHTTGSAVPDRTALTLRQPVGVAALIVAANTPVANVAWKVFPSLVCGNASVLKAAEDAPATAWLVADLAREVGVPPGVLQVVQGLGSEAGAALVAHPQVRLISFTGSTAAGRAIQQAAAPRFAKVCLELGGKNALVVCDDADLDEAARWSVLSAFSNAGQRCAAGSRIVVLDSVHDAFRAKLLDRVRKLKVGVEDDCDLGPVLHERALARILAALERARAGGAKVLVGGARLTDPAHAAGCYLEPTVLEEVPPSAEISRTELFGPVVCLYRARDLAEAIALVNDSPFGLTAAIHTRDIARAHQFVRKAQVGMVVVNGGTYGNEPHMPFGGVKDSGNGWRDTGPQALDVYSEWKTVYSYHDARAPR